MAVAVGAVVPVDSLFDPGSISDASTSACRVSADRVLARHLFHTGCLVAAEPLRKWPRLFSFLILFPAFIRQKNLLPAAVLNVRICCFSSVLGPPGLEEPVQVCGGAVVQISRVFFTASDRCSVCAPSRCEERWPGWGPGWGWGWAGRTGQLLINTCSPQRNTRTFSHTFRVSSPD